MGLYDLNYKRDFVKGIKQWLFEKKIAPNDSMILGMNRILRTMKKSGKNEYYPLSSHIPIVSDISNLRYKFIVDMDGDYFYLYSYPCKSGKKIRSFIEKKIADNFSEASLSPNDIFSCSNRGGEGPNILFLVSIDKNWNYELLPVGLIVIDQEAPILFQSAGGSSAFTTNLAFIEARRGNAESWPKYTLISKQNMLIHIPDIPSIKSYVSISIGHFQGDDYFGYNVPFEINSRGDLKTVTIANHRISMDDNLFYGQKC